MQNFDINLSMNDDNGKYNITLGHETIYSVPQSEGLDGINLVFDAIAKTIEITVAGFAQHSETENISLNKTEN